MFHNQSTIPDHHGPNGAAPKGKKIEYLPALFLIAAVFFLPKGTDSDSLGALAIVFISIVLEAIPFMLVGSLVGGVIESFVSRERLAAIVPGKGWLTVCMAAGAGIIFPVCECAVVPVVRRLIGKGLPISAAIAYLLGGPIVNPIVAASTALAYAFDWRIVILRMALGYGIAVVIGLIMGRIFRSGTAIKENSVETHGDDPSCGCCGSPSPESHGAGGCSHTGLVSIVDLDHTVDSQCGCGTSHRAPSNRLGDRVGAAFCHAMDDFLAVGHYLIIGAFIAALAQTYVDRSSFLNLAGAPLLSVVLMMGLAVLLNLCSEADAFIAASFQGLVSVPAQLAFMLTGPMFDLKLLLMYQSVFKRRAIVVLALLILAAVLGVATVLQLWNGGTR